MEQPGDVIIISKERWARLHKLAVLGIALAGLCFSLWMPIVRDWLWPPAVVVVDPRMERLCSTPTSEGRFTGYAVVNGKLVCWRM